MSSGPTTALEEVARRLGSAERVLITCHRGPDGDSVGSMIALASLLREAGKVAILYSPDLVPRYLKWMPLRRGFVQHLKKNARFDTTVVVDCGDPKLLGPQFPAKEVTGDVLVLDHHASGRPFGDVFVCDPEAACVGVLVARLAALLGWPIAPAAATGIYVSLLADTGGFRHPNANPEAFRVAADLVEGGLSPTEISERLAGGSSIGRVRLLSAALASIELAIGGKVAFMTITQEMVSQAKAAWEDTEGMINYARAINGVECGVLISPAKKGGIRVSMRSTGMVDAGKVCLELGGGGHPGAAGCTLEGEISAARERVEETLAAAVATATVKD